MKQTWHSLLRLPQAFSGKTIRRTAKTNRSRLPPASPKERENTLLLPAANIVPTFFPPKGPSGSLAMCFLVLKGRESLSIHGKGCGTCGETRGTRGARKGFPSRWFPRGALRGWERMVLDLFCMKLGWVSSIWLLEYEGRLPVNRKQF